MPTIPGTIDLGKFRVVYEEEQEHGSGESDGYRLQQRAIIRLILERASVWRDVEFS